MKKLLSLATALLFLQSALASQFDRTQNGWYGDIDLMQGFSSLSSTGFGTYAPSYGNIVFADFSALRLGFTEVIGYKSLFYLRLRESISLIFSGSSSARAFTNSSSTSTLGNGFDSDAALFFPIYLDQKRTINLQPALGIALHQVFTKYKVLDDQEGTQQRIRFIAPFVGLFFETTQFLYSRLRAGFAYHFPYGRFKVGPGPYYSLPANSSYGEAPGDFRLLKRRRHGVSAELCFEYALKEHLHIKAELDYFAYGASADVNNNSDTWSAHLNQLAFTYGIKYAF